MWSKIDLAAAVSAAMAIAGIVAQTNLVNAVGEAARKTLKGLSDNPVLTIGIITGVSMSGTLTLIAYKNLRELHRPVRPVKDASEADHEHYKTELRHYEDQYKTQKFVAIGCLFGFVVILAGGLTFAFLLNESEVRRLAHQLVLHKDAKDSTALLFLEAANIGSPSFALVYNNTDVEVSLHTDHTYGLTAGPPQAKTIPSRHRAVIGGGIWSYGAGQGVAVKRCESNIWKEVSHGEIISITDLDARKLLN